MIQILLEIKLYSLIQTFKKTNFNEKAITRLFNFLFRKSNN